MRLIVGGLVIPYLLLGLASHAVAQIESSAYFPLRGGTVWSYEADFLPGIGTITELPNRVIINGRETWVLESGGASDLSRQYFSNDDMGLRMHRLEIDIEGDLLAFTFEPPMEIMPDSGEIGDTLASDGLAELRFLGYVFDFDYDATSELQYFEERSVPFGSFEEVLRVRLEFEVDGRVFSERITLTEIDRLSLVEGLGLIRLKQTVKGEGNDETVISKLVDFETPGADLAVAHLHDGNECTTGSQSQVRFDVSLSNLDPVFSVFDGARIELEVEPVSVVSLDARSGTFQRQDCEAPGGMLLPSESFLCEFVVDIDCGAKNQFTACADPDDDLAESNENNNCLVPPEIVMPEPAALPCAAMALVTILALRRRSVARVGRGLANTVL